MIPLYARLTTIDLGQSETVAGDVAAAIFEHVLPLIQELPGFAGFSMLAEADGQRIAALTFWSTLEALAGAEPILESVKRAETAYRDVVGRETRRFDVAGWKFNV
jgi:hypothetical protein